MLIKIIKDYKYEGSGPTWSVGSIVEMDDEHAEKLVSGGYAEEVELVDVAQPSADDDVDFNNPQDEMEGLEEDASKTYPKGGSPVPEKVAPTVMLAGPDGDGPKVVDDGNLTVNDEGEAVLDNTAAYEAPEPVDGADLADDDDNE